MFEAAVDGFGGAVAGVGVIEVGQDAPARRLSVLPKVVSSVREEGMPVEVRRAISGSSELSVGDRVLSGGCG